jgi:NO-binding membrane sensor protein with MHYT domain
MTPQEQADMANEFAKLALAIVAAENNKRQLSARAVASGFVSAATMVLQGAGMKATEIAQELRGMANDLEMQSSHTSGRN